MKTHLAVLVALALFAVPKAHAGGWDYLWGEWEQRHTNEFNVVITPTNIVISTSATQEIWQVTAGTGIITGLKVQRGDQKLEATGSVKFNEMYFSLGERRWFLRKAGSKSIVFPPGQEPNQPPTDTPDLLLNHTKVKEGMTLPEVITLLGQPTSLEGKVLCYFGRYHSRRGMAVRVHFENEKVSKVVTGTWWDHPEPHMERE